MKKQLLSISLLTCILLMTACGNTTEDVEEASIQTENQEADATVENPEETGENDETIDYDKIAEVYKSQLDADYEEAKNTFNINKDEYIFANSYLDSTPINTEVIYKLEDLNNDGICEMMEVVTASQEGMPSSMYRELDVVAVRVYSYEDEATKLIYNLWDFYPNMINAGLTVEYDYRNNQFCIYRYDGGGGMGGESYVVIRDKDGAISKDYMETSYYMDPETYDTVDTAWIFEDVSFVDFSDAYSSAIAEKGEAEATAEEAEAFLSGVNIHKTRAQGIQSDDVYLNANKSTEETIKALLERKTTTIYDENNLRYYIENMQFTYEDGEYFASGNLCLEDSYMETLTQPSTHVVEENVKYKVADGASIFSMCGAYGGTIEDRYGETTYPVGYGPVVLSNDTVYGMLEVVAE